MTAAWIAVPANGSDVWLSSVGGSWNKNGKGPRLQVGKQVIAGVTWIGRAQISIDITDFFPLISDAASISEAWLTTTIRGTHGCIAVGSGPKVYVKRITAGVVSEGTETSECAVGGSPTPPTTTETNKVAYDWVADAGAAPSAGDAWAIDLAALLKDLYTADPSATSFDILIVAQDETVTSQKVAFNSKDTTPTWTFYVLYETSSTPDAPANAMTPNGTRLVGGTTTRHFTGDYQNADGSALSTIEIVVATNSHVDANGKLDTSTVSVGASSFSYDSTTHLWGTDRVLGTQTRGTRYYWVCRVTSANGVTSAWSAVHYWDVNQLPTISVP